MERLIVEKIDFRVRDEGTLVIIWPVSNEAVSWANEHLPDDCTRWGDGYVIDHRYAADVISGLFQDGLIGGRA